jgi:PAS domain-containing protein
MERLVNIYVVKKIEVPHVTGASEEDIVANAVTTADLQGVRIARYEVEGPDGPSVYHDRRQLETLHEDRLNYALPFDLEEHIDDTAQAYLTLPRPALVTATWEWDLATDKMSFSEGHTLHKDGCSFEEYVDWTHPEDQERLRDAYHGAINSRQPFSVEFRSMLRDGVWIESRGEVVCNEAGGVVGLKGIVVPVIEPRQDALETGETGAWDLNLQTGEIHWSENLKGSHGYFPDGNNLHIEQVFRNIVPSDVQRVQDAIDEAISTGQTVQLEYRVYSEYGSIAHFNSCGHVIYDRDGTPLWLTGICTEVTEKRLNQ